MKVTELTGDVCDGQETLFAAPIHGPFTTLSQAAHSLFPCFCSTVLSIVAIMHAYFLGMSIEESRSHVLARSRDKAFLAAVRKRIGIIAVHICILRIWQDIFIRPVRVGPSARSGQRTIRSMLLAVTSFCAWTHHPETDTYRT